MTSTGLDDCVYRAADHLKEDGLKRPELLFLLGTGSAEMAASLEGGGGRSLKSLPGTPPMWHGVDLVHGRIAGREVWLVEDAPGGMEFGEEGPPRPPWERGFPVWLAAASGALLSVVTAAGGSTGGDVPAGTICAVSDHLNLSGQTPLLGLGETRLGPLFPDQSLVHHHGLRSAAQRIADSSGLPVVEGVAGCVAGPALTTPAERAWLRTSGADVYVQGLAGPLLACAHAGISTLTLVAVTDDGEGPTAMVELVQRAEALAPQLETLIAELTPDLVRAADELQQELE